jgi:NitT/TauT family transport system substrate-binding protein
MAATRYGCAVNDSRPARSAILALALALTLALVACGGPAGSGASPTATAGGSDGGSLELAQITIGLLPIVDVAPVYLAIERGLFEAEGLTISPEVVQGGAAAIPALVSGDLDIAYGNWVSFLLANQEGIELRAIADGVAAAPGFTEFLALPDSGLEGDPAGMAGKTVALNTLNNVGELALRSTLRSAGVEADTVQLTEIPFPDMGATLERGDVDVIWASEPVPTITKSTLHAVVVADSFVGEMDGFPVAGYQATAEFVAEHPNTVAAFGRAMAAAVALIEDDPSIVVEIVPTYTGLEPGLAGEIALPTYRTAIEVATLERVHDELIEFEMLEPGLDVRTLVVAEPPGG